MADPFALIERSLDLLQPPQNISTVDCAEKYRLLPGNENGAVVRYDRWRTPYNVGPMASLDDPKCQLLVMVKPSRSGGTAIAENYVFKLAMFGPMTHVAWVLNSDEAVTDYVRTVIKPMFELNRDLMARVGTGRGENTDGYKLVSGYPVEFLSSKDSTWRSRQPGFIECDETDAWAKRWAASPKVQIDGRQKMLGNRRKAAIMSHADLGYTAGVAAAYEHTTRGIFVMTCPECLGHAAAYATKFWDEVPQFKLYWQRGEQLPDDQRIAMAEKTAGLSCPHCGAILTDAQRLAMIDGALKRDDDGRDGWMHRGQVLDNGDENGPGRGVTGPPLEHAEHGYWVHGTMLKTQSCRDLAKGYEMALIKYERTRDPTQLKEFMAKQLGEVYEGAATTGGVSVRTLKARVDEAGYERGEVPEGPLFITTSVDPGKKQLDVLFDGWDLEGRCWALDRVTIRQRQHDDGQWRDLDLYNRIEDWDVLLPLVVDRRFPLAADPDWALPVAVVLIDNSDGQVTWKAREFARRARRKGYAWGNWSRIKLIKGQAGKRPILPEAPTRVDKDENGKQVEPALEEYRLGVDRLKEITLERLAVPEGETGHCQFYRDFETHYLEQFFGEALIDGKWVRNGPNESLDLRGYNEAGRQLLKPDRAEIDWNNLRPVWARAVRLQPEVTAKPTTPVRSIFDEFQAMNDEDEG